MCAALCAVAATSLSKNGEWFAYRVSPQEGDAELVVRNIASGKELKFPLGEAPGGGAGVVIGGGASFSDDSKWIAFTSNPSREEAQRLRRQRRPVEPGNRRLLPDRAEDGVLDGFSIERLFRFLNDLGQAKRIVIRDPREEAA